MLRSWLLLSLFASTFPAACSPPRAVERVRVDIQPLRHPWGVAIDLAPDGSFQAIEHNPGRLLVRAQKRGNLVGEAAAACRGLASAVERAAAPPAPVVGAEEGDVVKVSLLRPGKEVAVSGLLASLPSPVRRCVERLLEVVASSAAQPPAARYLRAQALISQQAERVLRRRPAAWRALTELPTPLRTAAQEAVALPGAWVALPEAPGETLAEPGQWYVWAPSHAFELSVFAAWNGSAPPIP